MFRFLSRAWPVAMPLFLACLPLDPALAGAEPAPRSAGLSLVPWPKNVTRSSGTLTLVNTTRIVAGDKTLLPLARLLSEEIFLATGLHPPQATGAARDGDVSLELAADHKGEAYTLTVGTRATVRGGSYQAVALGTATLVQALQVADGEVRLPRLVIADQPRFAYRGALLDVVRKPYSIETLKQCVRVCRFYKIRYLHLHLTDENAWTFPSTAFPKLGSNNFAWAGGGKPVVYKRDDLRELIASADACGVTLVPEIEMPGHSGQLRGTLPEVFGYVNDKGKRVSLGVINMVSEDAYRALDTLVGEVCDVFRSSPYFVMGGDESSLGGLETMPEVKAFMAKHRLADTTAVFNAFVNRLADTVKKHGKRPIVWEGAPLRPAAPPKDLIVLPWVGGSTAAAALVRDGYTVINAPWDGKAYLDPYQVNGARLKKGEPLLLGATSILWERPQEAAVPYLRQTGALRNEPLWDADGRDLIDCLGRMHVSDARLDRLLFGLTFAAPQLLDSLLFQRLEPAFTGQVPVKLVTSLPGGRIRYTLDGREPNGDSPAYDKPLLLRRTTTVKARWFGANGKPMRPAFTREFQKIPAIRHAAVGAAVTFRSAEPGYYGPGPRGLTDGLLAAGDESAASGWVGWAHGRQPLEIRLDLGKPTRLTSVAAHFLRAGGGVAYPRQVEYAVSADGTDFHVLATVRVQAGSAARGWYEAKVPETRTRYLLVRPTPGGEWTFSDEVAVNATLPGPTLLHAALAKPVTLAFAPAENYNICGVQALTDGHVARSPDFLNPQWIGVEGKNLEATVDLGRRTDVRRVGANFLQHVWAGIRIPQRVDVLVSEDGKTFRKVATIEHAQDKGAAYIKTLTADVTDVQARYVKLVAYTNGQWLFADEVFVNPQADGESK